MKGKIYLCELIIDGPRRSDLIEMVLVNPDINTIIQDKETVCKIVRKIKGKSFCYDDYCKYITQYKIRELKIIKHIGDTNYDI